MPKKQVPPPPLLREFGDRVRSRRQELGLSQENLAHEAGLHRSYIGQVESGQRNVALENLARLARALGLSLGQLLDGLERMRGRNR